MTSLADIYGDEPIARFVLPECDDIKARFMAAAEAVAGPQFDADGQTRWELEIEAPAPALWRATLRPYERF